MNKQLFTNKVQTTLKGFKELVSREYASDEVAFVALILNNELSLKLDNPLANKKLEVLRETYKDQFKKYCQKVAYGKHTYYGYKVSSLYNRIANPSKLYAWEWEIINNFLKETKNDKL